MLAKRLSGMKLTELVQIVRDGYHVMTVDIFFAHVNILEGKRMNER